MTQWYQKNITSRRGRKSDRPAHHPRAAPVPALGVGVYQMPPAAYRGKAADVFWLWVLEMIDTVNHPAHYNEHPSGVECITIVEGFNFNLGNAIKYIWRAGLKSDNAAEDLQKALWYIRREIERLAK